MKIHVALLVTVCTVSGVASWQLSIQPADYVTIEKSQSVTILCKADRGIKLTDCGFQIASNDGVHYFNASLGPMTEEDTHFGNLTVKYLGSGLDHGECEVQLTAPNHYKEETFLVGCRARTEFGGWKYNYVYVENSTWRQHEIKLQTFPNSPYLLPGFSITIRCDCFKNDPIQACKFTLPDGQVLSLNENSNQIKLPKNVQYVGVSLDHGHCGIFIPNVSLLDTSKGNTLTCDVCVFRKNCRTRQIQINLAEPPVGDAALTVPPPEYKIGSELVAKCVAPKSSPPATITWYLDGAPVAPGSANARIREEPVAEWRWRKDAQTTTQFLAVTLAEGDDGARFRCEVSHMTLAETGRVSLTLTSNKVPATTPSTSATTTNTSTTTTTTSPFATTKSDEELTRRLESTTTDAESSAPIAFWVWVLAAVVTSVAVNAIMIIVYHKLKKARGQEATDIRSSNAEASATPEEYLEMMPDCKESGNEYVDVNWTPSSPEPIYYEVFDNIAAAAAARSTLCLPLNNVADDHAKNRLEPARTGSNRTDMSTENANLPASETEEDAGGYLVPRSRNVK